VRFGESVALHDISIRIPGHTLTIVIGSPGSGKTALMKALSCELPWGDGSIWIDEVPARMWPPKKLAACRMQCPLDSARPCERTASEVLCTDIISPDQQVHRLEQALDLLGVAHLAGRRCASLSQRDSRRLELAYTLARLMDTAGARHLWLDDPLDGLDNLHQHRLLAWLRTKSASLRSTLITMSDQSLARSYAGHAILLREGRLISQGEPDVALSAANLTVAFGGPGRPAY
jgi:iron complex transport system ATP-binding protein